MKYSPSTNGFYAEEIHGKNIPGDAVKITKELHQSLMNAQATGKIICADLSGNPVAINSPTPPKEQLLASVKSEMRLLRDPILNRVMGISAAALVTGNTALAQECIAVRQQLLDITQDPAFLTTDNYDAIRLAALQAYRRIAESVSAGLRSAFKEIEA